MARDASGNYSLPGGNPVVSGTLIQSAGWWNPTGVDIATALTDSLSRSGFGGMLAGLKGVNGTAGAPTFAFTSETGLGWYRGAAGFLSAAVGGIRVLDLTGSTADNVILQLLIAGSTLKIARSGDGALTYLLGSTAPGVGDFRIQNTGGSGAKLDLGGGEISVTFNAVKRLSIAATVATATTLYEPILNIAAAALFPIATQESGTFVATITGCTTAPTFTVNWRRVGSVITMDGAGTVALSNSAACTFTGMTAALSPARNQRSAVVIQSSGTNESGYITILGGTTVMTLTRNNGTTTFVNDGLNKGSGSWTISYNLN